MPWKRALHACSDAVPRHASCPALISASASARWASSSFGSKFDRATRRGNRFLLPARRQGQPRTLQQQRRPIRPRCARSRSSALPARLVLPGMAKQSRRGDEHFRRGVGGVDHGFGFVHSRLRLIESKQHLGQRQPRLPNRLASARALSRALVWLRSRRRVASNSRPRLYQAGPFSGAIFRSLLKALDRQVELLSSRHREERRQRTGAGHWSRAPAPARRP